MSASMLAQLDHAWIGTGKVRARITPTGIHPDSEGGFLLESTIPGQAPKNLLSHLTPWVVGIDQGNNLKLACEMDDPLLSDWKGGFRGVPNSAKVWKVTRDQIKAHLEDYADNNVIDNPIPSIFAWPAKGNTFSEALNGFSIDSVNFFVDAPFHETSDFNGLYNPENGDYPAGPYSVLLPVFPNEIVYAPLYDDDENELSQGKTTGLDGFLFAYTLDCEEYDFAKNSVYFEFGKFRNAGEGLLDSLHLGVYADFNIGNPNDDYLGSLVTPGKEMVFCYNSDTLHDNVLGANPPLVAFVSLAGPDDQNANLIPMTNFIPIYSTGPGGTKAPIHPVEFYRYITSTWRDGTPLSIGGTGYNPGNPIAPRVKIAFPDHPTDPSGWSELAENNPKNDRKCVISYGPTTLPSQYVINPIRFALTVSDKIGLTQQLQHLDEMREWQKCLYFGNCFSLINNLCKTPVSTQEPIITPLLAPNPSSHFITLKTPGIELLEVSLFNSLGQKVSIDPPQFMQDSEVQVSLKNLQNGFYFLHWRAKNGQHGCEKVVKN